ncbi:unnamed protein product [Hermetia illucens]|uniref:Chitin-binding type-2 domain-containing protein n=1 Tax=Hermetia illucens TaxID=343691 RepID=A0A7R8UID8_HERIL|nr:peritrophin-48-like [Hermetia illucens]CAD7080587.1 unnamed protein product [Hermetia illucens]
MTLGIILRLLIPTLGILLAWNINHVYAAECEGHDLYVPYPFPGNQEKYQVCFSETGDFKDYDCPPYLIFNGRTKSCTVYLGNLLKCTSVGENIENPHAVECEDYFTCGIDMIPSPRPCGSSEYFNPLVQSCVPKADYNCKDDIPDCSKPEFRNRMWVNKESCESFYECSGNILVSRKCPSKMFFNAHTQSCMHNVGNECKVPDYNSDLLVKLDTMCKGNVGKFLPDPYYCKAYYYCIDESTPYWQYCNNDRYFSNGSCSITRPSSCICEDLTWEDSDPDSVNVPHPDNTKYYVCRERRQPEEKTCPAGTTYNVTKKMCSM